MDYGKEHSVAMVLILRAHLKVQFEKCKLHHLRLPLSQLSILLHRNHPAISVSEKTYVCVGITPCMSTYLPPT